MPAGAFSVYGPQTLFFAPAYHVDMSRCPNTTSQQCGLSGAYLVASRLLLFLTGLLLAVMPFTEHFLVFDHFLQSGQDFELSLLATLSVLCLVLLLAHSLRVTMQAVLRLLTGLPVPWRLSRPLSAFSEGRDSTPSRPASLAFGFAVPLLI